MNLQEKAKAAHQEERTKDKEQATRILALKSAKTTELALKIFGVEPEEVDGVFATIDGLRFRRIGWGEGKPFVWHFVLFGICPKCKSKCVSEPIHNLADLGKMLGDFRAQLYHRCTRNAWCRLFR